MPRIEQKLDLTGAPRPMPPITWTDRPGGRRYVTVQSPDFHLSYRILTVTPTYVEVEISGVGAGRQHRFRSMHDAEHFVRRDISHRLHAKGYSDRSRGSRRSR